MATTITTVNITLRTATVSKAGFGTMLFLSSHRKFKEKVRSYVNMAGVSEDFSASDSAYKAASHAFGSSPSMTMIKIGRVESNLGFTIESDFDVTDTFSIGLVVNDNVSVVSYVPIENDAAEDVISALKTAVDSDVGVYGVETSISGGGTTLVISQGTAESMLLGNTDNLEVSYIATEDYSKTLSDIEDEDSDFYFVTADARQEADVLNLASAIQSRKKVYFTSYDDQNALTTLSDSSNDIGALVKELNYTRTAVMFSQNQADYVECAWIACNAPYSPDESAVVWDSNELVGVPVAKDNTGRTLTVTQQLNLEVRNVSYVSVTSAGDRLIGGRFANGGWIDDVINGDCVAARVAERLDSLLLNQKGAKIQGGTTGKALCKAEVEKALQPFIASKALESFDVSVDNANIDLSTRTLENLQFTGFLAGAIIRVIVNGVLTNSEE